MIKILVLCLLISFLGLGLGLGLGPSWCLNGVRLLGENGLGPGMMISVTVLFHFDFGIFPELLTDSVIEKFNEQRDINRYQGVEAEIDAGYKCGLKDELKAVPFVQLFSYSARKSG